MWKFSVVGGRMSVGLMCREVDCGLLETMFMVPSVSIITGQCDV